MTTSSIPGSSRLLRIASFAFAAATIASLSACGGGGSATPPTATVTSATVSSGRFGSSTLLQISGTNLDKGLAVSSSDCTGLTLLTAAPYVSTATNAFYSCTIAKMTGTVQLAQKSDGSTITTASFTVTSLPQVQFTFSGPVNASVIVDLAADKEPITVANFLHYVNNGLYNGLIIHRVTKVSPLISSIGVLQGGGYGPTATTTLGTHVTTYPAIPLEIDASLHNAPGTIAMARTSDPNSATSEFYFNVQDDSAILDGNYAVFGSLATAGDITTLQAIQGAACTVYPTATDGSCLPIPNVFTQTVVQIR